MKIGILTLFYNNLNYGGCLQTYALTKVLNDLGYDAEQISFDINSILDSRTIFWGSYTSIEKLRRYGVWGGVKALARKLKQKFEKDDVKGGYIESKEKSFNDFSSKIKHSTRIYNHYTLSECLDDYDAFVVGSDQVWNFTWYSPHFFLDFVPQEAKIKISYSASTGTTKFDFKQKEYLKKSLSTFDAISVREKSTVKPLSKIIKRDCVNTLDPTLLLLESDYNEVSAGRLENDKYIFCYFLSFNKRTRELVEEFAKSKNLKILILPMIYQDGCYGDRQVNGGPDVFLSLIKHAEYVFTDSFHAVIFSHIFKTQFYAFKRVGQHSQMNVRLKDLLTMTGNAHRLFSSKVSCKTVEKSKRIDYSKQSTQFCKMREHSLDYLKTNLKEKNGKNSLPFESCSACGSCATVCPNQCISIKADTQGNYFPVIDKNQCVDCDLCKKVCPILNRVKCITTNSECYALKTQDLNQRLKSSSGGAFYEISKYVLSKGGVVFGAAFDSDFKVKHTCVESLEDLTCLQQSKYVQSDVGDSYKKTEDLLKTGRLVLYSGTSCQIFGLKNYLRKEYGNLLTLDLICHGAPLDWVWELYLKFLKTKYNCEIEEVSFRDKTFGWRNFALCVKFKNGETIKEEFKNNLYMQVFLKNLSLKSSCYNCYFKGFNRVSDFTLGDAWGIEKFCPAIDDGLGVSLIYVNSAKGKEIFDSLSSLDKVKVDNIEAIKTNLMMVSSVREPKNRKKFLNKVNETNFEKISNKYLRQGLVERTLKKVKRIIRK